MPQSLGQSRNRNTGPNPAGTRVLSGKGFFSHSAEPVKREARQRISRRGLPRVSGQRLLRQPLSRGLRVDREGPPEGGLIDCVSLWLGIRNAQGYAAWGTPPKMAKKSAMSSIWITQPMAQTPRARSVLS